MDNIDAAPRRASLRACRAAFERQYTSTLTKRRDVVKPPFFDWLFRDGTHQCYAVDVKFDVDCAFFDAMRLCHFARVDMTYET